MANYVEITLGEALILNGTDEAFKYSVDNNDEFNMRIVLRAYDYANSPDEATRVIDMVKENQH